MNTNEIAHILEESRKGSEHKCWVKLLLRTGDVIEATFVMSSHFFSGHKGDVPETLYLRHEGYEIYVDPVDVVAFWVMQDKADATP